MNEKNDCKIVQDLLPNYMEELTDKETNKFIEQHLKECKNCKNVYESLRENIEESQTQKNEKKVDFLRKYRNKLKMLRIIIGVILLGILLIFCIITGRKMLVFKDLNQKIKNYTNSENYFLQSYHFVDDTLWESKIWRKDGKYLSVVKMVSANEEEIGRTITNYFDGETSHTYVETDGKKYALLNSNEIFHVSLVVEWLPTIFAENIKDLLEFSMTSSITTEICNHKECYKITRKYKEDVTGFYEVMYIEKETGLLTRYITPALEDGALHDSVVDYQYNFESVTDNDLVEPDIAEYEMIENYYETINNH